MTPRTKSNTRGKRPDRPGPSGSTPKKTTFTSHVTPEEALRGSKLTNAEKQAEAEAARDAAEAEAERKKAEHKSSWWDQPPRDYRPRSPGPSHSSTGSQSFASEANEEAEHESWWDKSGRRFSGPAPASTGGSQFFDDNADEPEAKPSTGSADRFFKTETPPESTYKNKRKDEDKARRKEEAKRRKRAQKIREGIEEARKRDSAIRTLLREAGPRPQYQQWVEGCAAFFSNSNASSQQFPIPAGFGFCREKVCVKGEKLGLCQHQLRELLMGSGEYEMVWLKRERLRWHPDKFPGRGEVQVLAQEMFQMIQGLIDGGG